MGKIFMKKGLIMLALTAVLSAASAMPALAAWEQEDDQWYYYDEQGDMLRNTWIGNYYVGTDGVMLTNALTPDGYWLDESGLSNEAKRIYGRCLFVPTGYQVVGNKIMIWGDIGDTGYASQKYIDTLKVGDTIAMPGDSKGVLNRFNGTDKVTETEISDGRKTVYVTKTIRNYEWWDLYQSMYAFSSKRMMFHETGSMETPIYRLIQEDVVLIADKDTKFISYSEFDDFCPQTITEFLERGGRNVLEVKVINGHIEQAIDIDENYAG